MRLPDRKRLLQPTVSSPPPLTLFLLAVSFLATLSCTSPDPFQAALRERQILVVDLLSWAPSQGRILLEIEINGQPKKLSQLTVLVSQYDSAETPLRRDRLTLDLGGIHGIGAMQTLASVPLAESPPVSVSVEVEWIPPEQDLGEFPELHSLKRSETVGD